MAKSLNRVTLLGSLGRDAETKFTASGVAVSNFSIATERSYKSGEEWKTETDWHSVVLWRKESLAPYLTKGQKVYVEGRLQTRSYDDKDGNKRYVTEVVAEEVILCGGRQESGDAKPRADISADMERRGYGKKSAPKLDRTERGSGDFSDGITDEDVPF